MYLYCAFGAWLKLVQVKLIPGLSGHAVCILQLFLAKQIRYWWECNFSFVFVNFYIVFLWIVDIPIKNSCLCLKEKTILLYQRLLYVVKKVLRYCIDNGINCSILIVWIFVNDNSFVEEWLFLLKSHYSAVPYSEYFVTVRKLPTLNIGTETGWQKLQTQTRAVWSMYLLFVILHHHFDRLPYIVKHIKNFTFLFNCSSCLELYDITGISGNSLQLCSIENNKRLYFVMSGMNWEKDRRYSPSRRALAQI